MELNTVLENIERTIEGKTHLLGDMSRRLDSPMDLADRLALTACVEFLQINVNELQRIANDIKMCIQENR